jgi:hypothetical protein
MELLPVKEKMKNILKLKSTHPHPFVAAFLEPSLEGTMPVNLSVNCFFTFLFYLVMMFHFSFPFLGLIYLMVVFLSENVWVLLVEPLPFIFFFFLKKNKIMFVERLRCHGQLILPS